MNEPLAIAYYLKEDLRQIWSQPNKRTARRVLRDWLARARASGIRMLVQFADTLEEHQEGILDYYDYPISTGPLEGTNNKIQTHETASLRLPRSRVLQTENPGHPRNKIRISRMNQTYSHAADRLRQRFPSASGRISANMGREVHEGRSGPPNSILAWSCPRRPLRLRSTRRVKRSRALLASNPTRDNPADGAPMASHEDPRPRWWTGVCFFHAHWTPELCLENASSALPPTRAAHRGLPALRSWWAIRSCRLQSLALAPTTIGVSAVAWPSWHP